MFSGERDPNVKSDHVFMHSNSNQDDVSCSRTKTWVKSHTSFVFANRKDQSTSAFSLQNRSTQDEPQVLHPYENVDNGSIADNIDLGTEVLS